MAFQLSPTDFYDYDMTIGSDGIERYHLCRNGQRLKPGFCTISTETYDNGAVYYVRRTQWHAVAGRRIEVFDDLAKAMRSGIDWAARRLKEDAISSTKGATR